MSEIPVLIAPPALVAAAQTVTGPLDIAAAAIEVGFGHVPVELLSQRADLLWLTLITVRAGLGLPNDPQRVRGWMRFGDPVNLLVERPVPGDVVIAQLDGGDEFAGVLVGDHRGMHIQVGPDEVIRVQKSRLVAARRPLAAAGGA